MSRATEYGTMADEVTGLSRSELQLGGTTLIDLDVQIELAKAKSVRNVSALQHECYRLVLLLE